MNNQNIIVYRFNFLYQILKELEEDINFKIIQISDEKALYITTQPSITLPQAELNYTYENLNFELEFGQSADSEIAFSNTGEEGSVLSYSVSQTYPEMNSPFDVTGGGPDSYGFYWK